MLQSNDKIVIQRNGSLFQSELAELLKQPVSGRVSANGQGLNLTGATVRKEATGRYEVVFTSPRASASYPILLTTLRSSGRDDFHISAYDPSTTSFFVEVNEQDNGGTAGVQRDAEFSFLIPN